MGEDGYEGMDDRCRDVLFRLGKLREYNVTAVLLSCKYQSPVQIILLKLSHK
jgi:hypothetical protein